MKTASQLKSQFEEIRLQNRYNLDKYLAGGISYEEWEKISDDKARKMAGWRRSFINWLANIWEQDYTTVSNRMRKRDNIDLYSEYLRIYNY